MSDSCCVCVCVSGWVVKMSDSCCGIRRARRSLTPSPRPTTEVGSVSHGRAVLQSVTMCPSQSHLSQSVPVCPSQSQCVPVSHSVSLSVPVCPSHNVSQSAPRCPSQSHPVSQLVPVCPSQSQGVPVSHTVSQSATPCPSQSQCVPVSHNVVVCGNCLVTLSLTIMKH